MKKRLLSLAAACALMTSLAVPLFAFAQESAPQAKETEEARFLRLVRVAEQTPYSEEADPATAFVVTWAAETPKYEALICPMAGPEWDLGNDPFAVRLMLVGMAGNIAWQIEHGKGADQLSKQLAATESALRVYEATVAKDSSRKSPFFDSLVAKRNAGTLREHLAPIVKKQCEAKAGQTTDLVVETTQSEAPPFLGGFLRESWVMYPLTVDGWKISGEHRYDHPAEGVSVRFVRKDNEHAWIDVFVYPVGVFNEAEVATFAESERQTLLTAWSKTIRDPAADMTPLSTITIPQSKTPDGKVVNVTAHVLDFAYKQKDEPLSSAMVVAVHNLYAIKLRHSAYASNFSRAQVRATLESFARALLPELDIQSNGTCFSSDHVYPGCGGPKELMPTAPDGKRLIHMEYAAPTEEKKTPIQGAPLRPATRGMG